MKKNLLLLCMLFLWPVIFFALPAPQPAHLVLIQNNRNLRTNTIIIPNRPGLTGMNEQQPALFTAGTSLLNSRSLASEDNQDTDEKIGVFYKGENLFRRAEILFFGSLTIVSFLSWISISVFNVLIYDEPFGVLKRHQYLALYLGSSVISLSVSISDLLIRLNKPLKKRNIKVFD